ncbi:ArsR/SmtB family transcription factor [Occultella gossypii]|uniref:Winged helix-turn-helix transcriptional regulator n=1 Tax=Occultella gossypii TaxID=2800820 RepID=A0ABS7SD99_9MICO|nr:metalloregulator ArsR/SmtB family transcription factor [Occultella gossypii]MBZ2197231.1 winged helix-turn-helix transcriptional regulator [Occultella gossypii]
MDAFVALADPVRRDLVSRLARGSARVVDLAGEHDISRPAISRHLRVLGDAGLVTADEIGRERHYRLERHGLSPVADYLAALAPAPRFDEAVLDGLDLEVRRTVRDHATPHPHGNRTTTEESA